METSKMIKNSFHCEKHFRLSLYYEFEMTPHKDHEGQEAMEGGLVSTHLLSAWNQYQRSYRKELRVVRPQLAFMDFTA